MQHIAVYIAVYYAEACNEWRGSHARLSAWATAPNEETLQRSRAVGDTVSNLTGPGNEPTTTRAVAMS